MRSNIVAAFDKALWEALQTQPISFELKNSVQPSMLLGLKKDSQGTPAIPAAVTAEKDDDGNIVLLVKLVNADAYWLKLDGSNADQTIDIGSEDLTTLGNISACDLIASDNVVAGTLTLSGGDIIDSTGTISFSTTNVTTLADMTCDELILTNPTQDWKFTSRGAKALVLQSQGAADNTLFEFWQGGVMTNTLNQFRMYWNSTPANQTNRETFLIGYDGSSCIELTTRLTAGTVRPIKIYHTGYANQVNVAINGNVGFGVASPQEDVHADDTVRADTTFNINGTDGTGGTFTTTDGKTVTVSGGIITAIV